jgi:uncharacterized membrane protein
MSIELTPKQRRRGLDFAEEVAQMAARSPDAVTKKELYAVATSMRKRYGYSESEKQTVVLAMIRMGASSASDLIRETGLDRPDVWRITKHLEEAGRIRLQKISAAGDKGGRPSFLFFCTE